MISGKTTFWGYKRENGRVGVRNHVIILPVDDLSNAACEAVAHNIKGALAIPHPYGRLQFGADLDLHFRTLIGTGSNPNVAAVVVIGIEEGWTKKIVDGIAATGKPVTGFGIELHGDHDTILRASRAAREYVQHASELQRVQCPIGDLWVSTKCGESDTTSGCGANPTVGNAFDKLYALGATLVFGETTELTGGEQLVAARCRNDDVRKKFQYVFDRYQEVINRHKTSDLSDSQPTKGNIAGGLTTIEEKALGNIQKIGRKCIVDGVLDKAEAPMLPTLETRRVRGLYHAGQINGTSGYEEAAVQGLIAGINAACALTDRDPMILRRDQAYAGVLVDDLVTRGTKEPYRMLTSRAEFRLLLREDNAVDRLMPIGRELGLVSDERWARFEAWRAEASAATERALRASVVGSDAVNAQLAAFGSAPLVGRRATLAELLRRPELDWRAVERIAAAGDIAPGPAGEPALERVEIETKYEGYLRRQESDAARLQRADNVRIPDELDVRAIPGLSREVIEKLEAIRPRSVGQASRISGVTPAAIAILLTHIGLFQRKGRGVGSRPHET